MARTDNLKNYLTDVGQAIKEKRNIDTTINGAQFDEEIKKISTGININGELVSTFLPEGEKINSGDFVYIKETLVKKTLSNSRISSGQCMITLDNNKFFVLMYDPDSWGTGYGKIFEIKEDGTLNLISSVILDEDFSWGNAVMISKNKILVTYGDWEPLYGQIITINEDGSLQAGTQIEISSNSDSAYTQVTKPIVLNDTEVLMIICSDDNHKLYALILTITGEEIIVTSQTLLNSDVSKYIGYYPCYFPLSDNRFVICQNESTSYQLITSIYNYNKEDNQYNFSILNTNTFNLNNNLSGTMGGIQINKNNFVMTYSISNGNNRGIIEYTISDDNEISCTQTQLTNNGDIPYLATHKGLLLIFYKSGNYNIYFNTYYNSSIHEYNSNYYFTPYMEFFPDGKVIVFTSLSTGNKIVAYTSKLQASSWKGYLYGISNSISEGNEYIETYISR